MTYDRAFSESPPPFLQSLFRPQGKRKPKVPAAALATSIDRFTRFQKSYSTIACPPTSRPDRWRALPRERADAALEARLAARDAEVAALREQVRSLEETAQRSAELSQANRSLRQANVDIREQSRCMLEHFACMSHEIRCVASVLCSCCFCYLAEITFTNPYFRSYHLS